ncbi:MAG: hypothetical protein MI757_15340 [Pirellulales bacterium]|nr:hypothetical protein [Pirellulales bacterium]
MSCHSIQRETTHRLGPPLFEIGRVAADRKPGMHATAYILESVMEPGAYRVEGYSGQMPKNVVADLDEDQIRDLVAYLCSLGADRPDYASVLNLSIERRAETHALEPHKVSPERMELARSVYYGKGGCAHCHESHVQIEYQLRAPTLFGAGLTNREEVRQSILDPSHRADPFYQSTLVVTKDGLSTAGRRVQDPGFDGVTLLVPASDGASLTLRRIAMSEIERNKLDEPMVRKLKQSPMPKGYGDLLSPEELDALVAMIVALN